jgi:hypothetical protein
MNAKSSDIVAFDVRMAGSLNIFNISPPQLEDYLELGGSQEKM